MRREDGSSILYKRSCSTSGDISEISQSKDGIMSPVLKVTFSKRGQFKAAAETFHI